MNNNSLVWTSQGSADISITGLFFKFVWIRIQIRPMHCDWMTMSLKFPLKGPSPTLSPLQFFCYWRNQVIWLFPIVWICRIYHYGVSQCVFLILVITVIDRSNDLNRFGVILVLLKFVKIASQVMMYISNIGIKYLVLILSNHQLESLIH